MRKLPTRQVHLDFHTSPLIPGVGTEFDKKQFQAALREGNINSVTIFAKCHHGYCYYPTKVGKAHPSMTPGFDLTGAMMDAAHEIGVDAPVYITAGWSVFDSENHPEWCMRNKDGSIQTMNYDLQAKGSDPKPNCSWKNLCMSGEYAEHIYSLTREICERYERVDGLFYDIIYLNDVCYCENCLRGMKEEGLNPDNIDDAREYYRRSHLRFMKSCSDILHEKHPEATVFFNSGGADIYRPEYHSGQTHFEMEDLPTAWGGYDKMPPRASVMSRYGKDFLGMTGKFHTEWGEFGGYKNPEALKYEALLMAMYGAKCSIGDQMLPSGKLDFETYKCIGIAYRELEKYESRFWPAVSTAGLGVYLSGNENSDEGLHRMLLEGHIDFEVILPGDDLSRFRAVILPDCVKVSADEAERIRCFAAKGGAVLFSGSSLVERESSAVEGGRFLLDPGAKFLGEGAYRQDYFRASEKIELPYANAPFFCYRSALRAEITDGEVLAQVYEPWFDRTYDTYCSHRNTPYRYEPAEHPAAVKKGNIIWLAHPFCGLYREYGAQLFREVVLKALSLIYKPAYTVGLPSGGRTRLTHQPESSRFVFHAAYAVPVQRGCITVLEDMPEFNEIPVKISLESLAENMVKTRKIYEIQDEPDMQDVRDVRDVQDVRDIQDVSEIQDVSDMQDVRDVRDVQNQGQAETVYGDDILKIMVLSTGEEIPFEISDGRLCFNIPKIRCYGGVEILYKKRGL